MATVVATVEPAKPTIVLLHGFLGDRRDMEPLRREINAASFDCVSVDLPHHGDSAQLVPQSVDAVAVLAEQLATGWPATARFVLVGYSMGGRIAMQLAAKNPVQIDGVVVLGSSPGTEDLPKRRARADSDNRLASRLRRMDGAAFAAWLRDEWYTAPLWGNSLRAAHCARFEAMLQRRLDGARPADRAASLERETVGRQAPLWSWLASTMIPVLYLAGADDPSYAPLAPRISACNAAGRVEARLVGGSAHAMLLEAPNAVAELCIAFLRSLGASGGGDASGDGDASGEGIASGDGIALGDGIACGGDVACGGEAASWGAVASAAADRSARLLPLPAGTLSAPPRLVMTQSYGGGRMSHPPRAMGGCGAAAVRLSCAAHLVPFSLPLTAPLALARGVQLESREGALLLLSGAVDGGVRPSRDSTDPRRVVHAVGELCPLPAFHAESLSEASEQLRRVCMALEGRDLPFELASLGGALGAWLLPRPSTATEALPPVLANGVAAPLGAMLPSVRCVARARRSHSAQIA